MGGGVVMYQQARSLDIANRRNVGAIIFDTFCLTRHLHEQKMDTQIILAWNDLPITRHGDCLCCCYATHGRTTTVGWERLT